MTSAVPRVALLVALVAGPAAEAIEIRGRAGDADGAPLAAVSLQPLPQPFDGESVAADDWRACDLLSAGRFVCTAERGFSRFALRAPGMAPRIFDLPPSVRSRVDLETVRFRPGSTVVGRVAVPQGFEQRLEEISVVVLERGQIGAGRSVPVEADGLFVAEAVAPGGVAATARYLLESSRSVELKTEPGELLLAAEPLRIARVGDLEIAVQPPIQPDELAAGWRIEVLCDAAGRRTATADGAGFAELQGLALGECGVEVGTPDGSVFASREVTLSRPGERLDVTLPIDLVAGEVVLDPAPEGELRLRFGKRARPPSVVFPLDDERRFTGFLPAVRDEWSLYLEGPTGSVALEPVELVEPDDDGVYHLRVEAPQGSIEGVVVRKGEPVPEAMVALFDASSPPGLLGGVTTDEEGRFLFPWLAAGEYGLAAYTDLPRGVQERVSLLEDREVSGIRLELDWGSVRKLELADRHGGPAADTRVIASRDLSTVAEARTDAAGRAEITVDDGRVDLLLASSAGPGIAVRSLALDRETETLRLTAFGGDPQTFVRLSEPPDFWVAAFSRGAAVPFGWLRRLAAATPTLDDATLISGLEPGEWTFCSQDGQCCTTQAAPHAVGQCESTE